MDCGCEEDDCLAVVVQHIQDTIGHQLGAWSGEHTLTSTCKADNNTTKRQSGSSTIQTQATLVGPNAQDQGLQIQTNMPQTSTANGRTVQLVSVESDDSELSDAAIAGIVIGSVIAAMLVLIALALILRRSAPQTI